MTDIKNSGSLQDKQLQIAHASNEKPQMFMVSADRFSLGHVLLTMNSVQRHVIDFEHLTAVPGNPEQQASPVNPFPQSL